MISLYWACPEKTNSYPQVTDLSGPTVNVLIKGIGLVEQLMVVVPVDIVNDVVVPPTMNIAVFGGVYFSYISIA